MILFNKYLVGGKKKGKNLVFNVDYEILFIISRYGYSENENMTANVWTWCWKFVLKLQI